MSNIVDPGNFFGAGQPPRSLPLGNQQTRFPVEGDSWTDTTTTLLYIYRNNVWNVMPIAINLQSMSVVYQQKFDSLVRVVAISNENLDELGIFDNYAKFETGGGFFVFNATEGYIVTCAHIILKSALDIPADIATPVEDNIFIRIFPENVIVRSIVIGLDRKMDIALLQINLNDPNLITPLGPRIFLNVLDNRAISIGTPIITLSNPQNTDIFPAVLIAGINTYRPTLQFISFGTITDNKYTDDSMHVESITTDNDITTPYSGGPLLDLEGNCLGLASWSLSNSSSNYLLRGYIGGGLISNVMTFLRNNYRGVVLDYPKGYLGLVYKYYTAQNLVADRINISAAQTILEGVIIQGTPGDPEAVVDIKQRDGTDFSTFAINSSIPALTVLESGDIITKGAPHRQPLISIGKMNNQIPLDTLIMLNSSLDLEYRRFSDVPPYSVAYLLINIRTLRPGYPNIFDFQYSQIS